MASNKHMDDLTDEKPNPIRKVIVAIVILALLGSNAYLFKQLQSKNHELDESTRAVASAKMETDSLNTEVDKLEVELEELRKQNGELDSLLSEKDKELERKVIQIRKLIASGDAAQLARARSEIAKLKEETNTFATDIEDLKRKNAELTTQNSELSTSLNNTKLQVDAITKEKGTLAEKVKLGSQMLAANIKVDAVAVKGSKEKVTPKAKSAQKLRICYTIMQNLVVEKGPRNIYIRVLGPDNAVLSSNVSNTFIYKDKATVYSEKKQYQFDNRAIDMCVYWDKTQDRMSKGDYTVELYDDLSLLGKGSVTLK